MTGFVEAPSSFVPLLEETFPDLVVWERVIASLPTTPTYRQPAGFTVRPLTSADADHLANLSEESFWISKTWGGPAGLAASGYGWAAFAGQQLAAVANVFFLGDTYKAIGVVTEPAFRGLGLSVACSGVLCEEIRARGHIRSWTTELKLITPYYQHVDGTSFAAPLVASTVACLLQANPTLTPQLVRDILMMTAYRLPNVPLERQGAGVLNAGLAVALALQETHRTIPLSPHITPAGVSFSLHDHWVQQVQVLGSWDGWQAPGLMAAQVEVGVWQTAPLALSSGRYLYKFILNGTHWLDDPANPQKWPDAYGGLNSLLVVP